MDCWKVLVRLFFNVSQVRVDQIGDLALTRVYLYAGPNNEQWTFIFNISHA